MSFTVRVGQLFHSIVYHVFADDDGIKFMIYDPFHNRFDLIAAEMCHPNDHLTQPPDIQKRILEELQKKRDLEAFRKDKEQKEYRERRRETQQKG